jgi:hypothetical protein
LKLLVSDGRNRKMPISHRTTTVFALLMLRITRLVTHRSLCI